MIAYFQTIFVNNSAIPNF